ncbi:hypothetical protein V1511DRAFT_483098 [Dipodascopsis uninucleata]
MAFASNNPFRSAANTAKSLDPFAVDTLPGAAQNNGYSGYRTASFNSKNPFLDLVEDDVAGLDEAAPVLSRRSVSDTEHENWRPLPDLLFKSSGSELVNGHNDNYSFHQTAPPPPPRRSNRSYNLQEEIQNFRSRPRRNSESSIFEAHGIIEAYMPLDWDSKPKDHTLHHQASMGFLTDSRRMKSRRTGSEEQEDPFATPHATERTHLKSHLNLAEDAYSSSKRNSNSHEHRSQYRSHKTQHQHLKSSSTSPPKKNSSGGVKSSSPSSKSRAKSAKALASLDKIDKLDVTGISGTGFHHDGPFDACNPHRNKNKKKAPMLAFPIDSENNMLGVPRYLVDEFHQIREVQGINSMRFDPSLKSEPVHGDISLGLGSSTFLEGAPASKAAIMQQKLKDKESDGSVNFSGLGVVNEGSGNSNNHTSSNGANSGLNRKKSIVQKIRGMKSEDRLQIDTSSTASARRSETISEEEERQSSVPRMIRQTSSPGASRGQSRSPTSPKDENGAKLLKRVKSLKVGGRRKVES